VTLEPGTRVRTSEGFTATVVDGKWGNRNLIHVDREAESSSGELVWEHRTNLTPLDTPDPELVEVEGAYWCTRCRAACLSTHTHGGQPWREPLYRKPSCEHEMVCKKCGES
jgi:hypothetical protein